MKRLVVSIRREPGTFPRLPLDCPERVFDVVEDLAFSDREVFEVLHLDTKHMLIARETIAIGTVDRAIVGAREVFSGAMLNGTPNMILVHNHPSGDPAPSEQDHLLYERLLAGAEILGLKILDHVVVGAGRCYSFSREGDLLRRRSA